MKPYLPRLRFLPSKQYNPETLDYKTRVLANGGTISISTLDAIEKFVRDCKDSHLWPLLTEVGVFAGDQLAAALVKLKYHASSPGVLTNNNFIAGDFVERGATGGLLGNGTTKFLNTGANPVTLGLTPSNHHIAVYSNQDAWSTAYRDPIGSFETVNRMVQLRLSGNDANRNYFYPDNQTSGVATNTSQDTDGLWCGNNGVCYRNGAVYGTTGAAASGTMPNYPWFIAATKSAGSPTGYFDKRICFHSIGLGLTSVQVAQLYSAVQTLQANLSRQA